MAEDAPTRDLAGRRALITGAGGDIGRAVATTLATRGADLVLADLAAADDGLAATSEASRAARAGVDVVTVRFDVAQPDEVAATFASLVEDGVTPDLLVNNAGYQGGFANLLDVSADEIGRVMTVNVVGSMLVLQAFAQTVLAANRRAAVVNLASMAGVNGAPNMAAYSASKAAIIGLTKSAAKDLAPAGIRVNAVSPGFIGPGRMWDNQVAGQADVASPYFPDDPSAVADQMIGSIPLRRYGSLDEVAAVIAFLLSDAAAYVTGTNTEISGGAA